MITKCVPILVICCLMLRNSAAAKTDDELLAVSVLYRHGDRTIAQSYPTDPYRNTSYWPVPFGELTNTGKKQHYGVGKWLRQTYNDFLSQKYLSKEFVIQSSNYDRCLMSAASNLAGLFPPEGDQVWNNAIPWQPIPIHTMPNLMDGKLALEKPCPAYSRLHDETRRSQYYRDLDAQNAAVYAYLTEKTGMLIQDIFKAGDLYDTLLIESYFKFTLPKWTASVFPDKLKEFAYRAFEFETHTPELAKFRVGQVFYQIISQFDTIKAGVSTQKFQVFSAHDTNVFAILNSLRIPGFGMVPYAGMVIFELRRRPNGMEYVRLLYKVIGKEAKVLTIKDCDTNCDFEQFKTILAPLTLSPEEWDRACHLKRARRRIGLSVSED